MSRPITAVERQLLYRSWWRACRALGLKADLTALRDALIAAYQEAWRDYHTLQHLLECLALVEQMLALVEHPGEFEMALWFHDAVYDPQGKGNEALSAAWARQALLSVGVLPYKVMRVVNLVMATLHDAEPVSPDAKLLADIDRAILGADSVRFAEYERQLLVEYAWAPAERFKAGRRKFLRQMLDRPAVFSTRAIGHRFEAAAQDNLVRALTQLN